MWPDGHHSYIGSSAQITDQVKIRPEQGMSLGTESVDFFDVGHFHDRICEIFVRHQTSLNRTCRPGA